MKCNAINNEINLFQTALDGYFEEKIDLDITIPDYSPSAEKIVKCEIIPMILSTSFDTEKMYIDGVCVVNVMYVDEQSGQMKSISDNVNFNRSFQLKDNLDNLRTKIKFRNSNVLCRLQNSKRISVKTVIGVAVKVMGNSKYELISGFEDYDVEACFENVTVTPYINSGETDINVSGEIQSDYPICDIVKYHADLLVTEVKVINERAIVKGNAIIECLYISGERVDDLQCASAVAPFSEIIDIPDAADGDICDTELLVTGLHIELGNSSSNNIINFEIEGRAMLSVFREVSVKMLKDVYSKTSKINAETSSLSVESLVKNYDFTDTVRESVDITLENATIKCVNAKAYIKNVSADGENVLIEGDVAFSIIAHNDSEYCVFDKTTSFKSTQQLPSYLSQLRCEANVVCNNVEFEMPDESTLDCKAELKFNVMIFSKNSYEVISGVTIDDETPGNVLDSKIVLYFASTGEKLWDIAKKYSVSVNNIKQYNNLNCEALDSDKMLLISSK